MSATVALVRPSSPTSLREPELRPGEMGIVPITEVVPDPNQPRQYFDRSELRQLADSIAAVGVREVLKVRVLTQPERESYQSSYPFARYEIVSGERRWRAANLAGVKRLRVVVEEYEDRTAQYEDAYLMNEARSGLGPIDNSVALNNLLENRCDGNVSELVRRTGRSRPWVEQHLGLMYLDPKIQALLSPELPDRDRITLKVAGYLYQNCSADQQRQFAEEGFDPEDSATQQILWIDTHLRGGRTGTYGDRYTKRPDKGRERLTNVLAVVRRDMLFFQHMSPADRKRMFRGASRAEVDELLAQGRAALQELGNWVELLKEASSGAIHPLEIPGMIEVDYYHERDDKLVQGTVITLAKYKRLGAAGRLAYQKHGEERPDHLPDPATIEDD